MTTLLVTGGTGSLGHAICELLQNRGPSCYGLGIDRVRVFSRNEYAQYKLQREFGSFVECILGDIRDATAILASLDGVDLVIHAAAIKHIDIAERNPQEAVKTNVLGSINVSQAAALAGVQRVLGISTDKACNPNSAYGTTKLLAEKLIGRMNVSGTTRYASARFGNLLGSSGSVFHVWKESARAQIPLKVTDPNMTRFFMRPLDAADFVVRALAGMQGGEVFVPKLTSFQVIDLAKQIQAHPEPEIVGLRLGEKLHEEMVSSPEVPNTLVLGDFLVIEPIEPTWEYVPYADRNPLRAPYSSEGGWSSEFSSRKGVYEMSSEEMSQYLVALGS